MDVQWNWEILEKMFYILETVLSFIIRQESFEQANFNRGKYSHWCCNYAFLPIDINNNQSL